MAVSFLQLAAYSVENGRAAMLIKATELRQWTLSVSMKGGSGRLCDVDWILSRQNRALVVERPGSHFYGCAGDDLGLPGVMWCW